MPWSARRNQETAIEVPFNVVTEWKNCPPSARSRDVCRRNSVTASLSQQAQRELTESVIVIPERPSHGVESTATSMRAETSSLGPPVAYQSLTLSKQTSRQN